MNSPRKVNKCKKRLIIFICSYFRDERANITIINNKKIIITKKKNTTCLHVRIRTALESLSVRIPSLDFSAYRGSTFEFSRCLLQRNIAEAERASAREARGKPITFPELENVSRVRARYPDELQCEELFLLDADADARAQVLNYNSLE